METRLKLLEPRLKAKASFLANGNPDADADDLFQEMCVNLLDKAQTNPKIAKQKDAYIMQCADWIGRKNGQASRTYRDYVDAMPQLTTERGDTVFLADVTPSDALTPEQELIFLEDAAELIDAIYSLSPENQTLVKMLYFGHEQVEIAKVLGITKGAVSQRKNTVRRAIASRISG